MTYAESRNGHVIVLMAAHAGPAQPELACFRKPRIRSGGGATTRYRHDQRPRFDGRDQVVYEIVTDGGGWRCVKRTFEGVGNEAAGVAGHTNRKGRPRGSKNKRSAGVSNMFNYRCEKKSFAYEPCAAPTACKACDQTFDGDPVIHCLERHEDACPVCGDAYRPPLAAHIRSHGVRPPPALTVTCYECYECKEKYGNAETMATHVRDQHVGDGDRDPDPDPVGIDSECAACGVRFDGRRALVEHVVAAHCPRKTFRHPAVYRCRACQAGFKSQINVLRHACNRIKSPHCARCDKTFPSKMRYSFHLQFHEQPGCAPMHLHCDICLAEFEDEYQLYDHIRFRHELHDKAVCEVCGRTFKSSMGLNIHRRYHNGSRNFACGSCDKSFLNKSTLKEHEISHMDVKPFQCHICGQYLSRASRLRSHVKTHKAAESTAQVCYCCARCGFVAPNLVLLTEHSNKEHDGDRTALKAEIEEEREQGLDGQTNVVELRWVVKCEFCDSTYMDAVSLNRHRNAAHTSGDDSEAFICVVCSSTFSSYSRLTTHKLTHGINMESSLAAADADKDRLDVPQYFSCQHCAKRCLHYTYFCLHRRLKHPPPGGQSHTCDQCAMDFETSWKLSYHKKTVHGQPVPAGRPSERYECSVCARKFVKIGALNLHKTRTHIDVNGDVCKYLCHVCGKFFSSECSLRNHSKTHDDDETERARDDRVTCRRKRRRSYRKSATVEPVAVAVVKNSFPYCDVMMDDQVTFVEHVNRHVQLGPAEAVACNDDNDSLATTATCGENTPQADPAVSCDLCDQIFADTALLGHHLAEHAAIGDVLLCVACSTPFLSSAVYDVHQAMCAARRHPDVRFVGPTGRALDVDGPQSALVIECAKIFNGATTRPSSAIDAALESSLLDELLGIMSTPPPPLTFDDHVDPQPPGDLQDIFDSLQVCG